MDKKRDKKKVHNTNQGEIDTLIRKVPEIERVIKFTPINRMSSIASFFKTTEYHNVVTKRNNKEYVKYLEKFRAIQIDAANNTTAIMSACQGFTAPEAKGRDFFSEFNLSFFISNKSFNI